MTTQKLDRGTRIYIAVLAGAALVLVLAWALSLDTRVWAINARLRDDAAIAGYPFPFRVLEIREGIAFVASPRSPEVSVLSFLGLVDPGLRNADPDSPRALAAQERLAEVQARVRKLVEAEPEIRGVRWRLDTEWFASRGVQLEP